MEKTASLHDLPHGTGAAMGAFIRALYLTASSRYAIIGLNVNNQGIFEKVGNTTTLVSDILLLFTGDRYTIDDSITSTAHSIGKSSLGEVYEISVSLHDITELSTNNCAGFYSTLKPRSITFTEPTNVVITFYICNVSGLISESRSLAALAEVLEEQSTSKTIPATAYGKRNSDCWSTLEEHKFTETLTLHFKNDSEEELSKDLEFLKQIYFDYVIAGNNLIGKLGD